MSDRGSPNARHFASGTVCECSDCGQAFDLETHRTDCPNCAESAAQAGLARFGADAGADADHDPRREHPQDDTFVDGRETGTPDGGDQAALVADTADDQLDLTGETADATSLW